MLLFPGEKEAGEDMLRMIRVCVVVGLALGASACSKTMCEETSAAVESSHSPYVVDGGHACNPTDGSKGAKRQNISYKMSVAELEKKYEEKFKDLGRVPCPEGLYGDVCFRDGLTILSAEFYTGDGSESRTEGSDAVVGLTVLTQSVEVIAERCTDAHKKMAGAEDFVDALSAVIGRCGEACDAEHEPSCGHLDKALGAVCGTSKDICTQLCDTLTGPAAKSRACALAK